MFVKINELMTALIEEVTSSYQEVTALKNAESNPMMFTEYSGRCFGIMEALIKIRDVSIEIEKETKQFVENSVDGQYSYLTSLYDEEIQNLQNQIYLLKKQLKAKDNSHLELIEEKEKTEVEEETEGNKE